MARLRATAGSPEALLGSRCTVLLCLCVCAGYVALFGYNGADARKMTITKNEGIAGVTGAPGSASGGHRGAGSQRFEGA